MNSIYQFDIEVSPGDLDRNGHVNNVVYIQWMQDAAIAHARASGCTKASEAMGATWVVRTHHVEYLSPAFVGEKITVLTWPSNFQRVRSLRKYKFIRAKDQAVIARAETDWIFVNAKTGRPQSIPEEVKNSLPIPGKELEP
ncbi:MAG TPA: acyl-CoA thioesterase [Verrucomicrobiae bacterium]|jgi:acyl-CoA thioester hydrolase|nr:acyl-CoA thioesterase [Verrucomicrobiae bacterium]